MNIVIAGAGDVGFHLAQLLESENQSITLIDEDEDVLEYAANHLDVKTIRGDASSIGILLASGVQKADLFLGVSTHEPTNLLACILAKKFGAKMTLARVSNPEYLHKDQKENFAEIGIDNLFSPRALAVKEVSRLLRRVSATDIFEFEDGKISIIGFTADNSSSIVGKTFRQLSEEASDNHLRVIVVLRDDQTIIPTKDMIIYAGDHIYLSTDLKEFENVNKYVGKTLKKIQKVMIIGGSPLAISTAKELEKDFSITLVADTEEACKECARVLKNTLVVRGKPNNTILLHEEGLTKMDAFIALTPNSETNIISSLMAEKEGVYKTIALVDNSAYTHISQNIGIDTIINKKILAANNIFRYVRKGKIEAIASFHGVDAEIIQFIIHRTNKLTKHTLGELHIPKEAVVAGVIRDDHGIIPTKDFTLQLHDKVIIFVLPSAIKTVEEIFK